MAVLRGGCLCGAVRYEVSGEVAATLLCHCTHCKKQSGSMFSTNLVVPAAAYAQSGATKVFEDRGDSGQAVLRHFCPDCGSPIRTMAAAASGLVILKAGTLDDVQAVTPGVECYTDRAAPWVVAVEGTARFPLAPVL